MPPFVATVIRAIVRHLLSGIGAWLVLRGVTSETQFDGWVAQIADLVGGALLFLLPVIWSVIEKRWAHTYIETAQDFLGVPKTGRLLDLVVDLRGLAARVQGGNAEDAKP